QPSVIGFNGIRGVELRAVPSTRSEPIENMWVHRCIVGGDLHRDDLRGSQRPGEEAPSRATISPRGHIHLDDLLELVDRPVDIAPPTGHLDVRLVHPPTVPDTVPAWVCR